MKMQPIKYQEGQWFAVPLRTNGYGIGIIVRGDYKSKGGLGYFFGPKYLQLPNGVNTNAKNKENAILVCKFGDLGIITGSWFLIQNGKPFVRNEWPVPIFRRTPALSQDKVVLVEYPQDAKNMYVPLRETIVEISAEVLSLPTDGLYGSGAVEIVLTRKIEV